MWQLGEVVHSYCLIISLHGLQVKGNKLCQGQDEARVNKACTNTWNTSIPPEVLSFQVKFVKKKKFQLMKDIFCVVVLGM